VIITIICTVTATDCDYCDWLWLLWLYLYFFFFFWLTLHRGLAFIDVKHRNRLWMISISTYIGSSIENFQIAQSSSKTTPIGSKTCFNMFLGHLVSFWSVLSTFENFRYFHCKPMLKSVTRKMASKKALNRLYLEKYCEK